MMRTASFNILDCGVLVLFHIRSLFLQMNALGGNCLAMVDGAVFATLSLAFVWSIMHQIPSIKDMSNKWRQPIQSLVILVINGL